MKLRTATAADVPFICDLVETAMRLYIEQTWGTFSAALTRESVEAMVTAGDCAIVELDGRDAGALSVERFPTHIQLAQIYLLPAFQNRGIGTSIVRDLVRESEETGKPLRLRVLASNPARKLYEREGFAVVGETKERYYMERQPVGSFYDRLTPFYDLIFEDWDASMARQGRQLSAVVEAEWPGARRILDVSCGIGTQAIALALGGYSVSASDISAAAVERAREAASMRSVNVKFSTCDMRAVSQHHDRAFDVIVSADNSVPHLLTDDEILTAFTEFRACLKPGGGCLITVRDYENEPRDGTIVKPYGKRLRGDKQYELSQVWDFEGDCYHVTFRIDEEDATTHEKSTHAFTSRYYAISTGRLCELMTQAGFERVRRLDGVFYQPVIVGTQPLRKLE
jgi:SAM-dependent methyltransferase/GNAT superfamily N-acetyltransferase